MSRHIGLVIGQLGCGGAERQLGLLARGLKEAGERVSVFCLSGELEPFGEELKAEGIPLFALRRKGHRETARVLGLAARLREQKIDLLHSFLETANIYSSLARPLAGRPVFIPTVRSLPAPVSPLHRYLHGRALKRAAAICSNSRAGAEAYAAQYGIEARRFRVIHNGISLGEEADEALRNEARLKFKVLSTNPVIGTAAKDTPDKNVPAFLRLASRLAAGCGGVCAVAAGEGLDESFAARHDMKRTGVCQAFFLGRMREMRDFYAALDLFVLTSLREGLPNVILEAMAAGLPVVAYAVGGVPEVVEEGVTGFLVPVNDEEALFSAACRLIKDRGLARRMGQAGRRRVEEHFSVEKMVAATRALYDELCPD